MEAKNIIRELLKNAELLTPGQMKFVRSVNNQFRRYKNISDKQLDILTEILAGAVKTVKQQ
jgi:hypothetical protein